MSKNINKMLFPENRDAMLENGLKEIVKQQQEMIEAAKKLRDDSYLSSAVKEYHEYVKQHGDALEKTRLQMQKQIDSVAPEMKRAFDELEKTKRQAQEQFDSVVSHYQIGKVTFGHKKSDDE